MAVVGHTLPVKLKVIGVFNLVNQFAEKEVHQFVEGVFPAGHVVLAQNGGKFVVLLLLVRSGNGVQIGQGILLLADLVGLNDVLKDTLGCEVELVCIAPDREALLYIGDTAERV